LENKKKIKSEGGEERKTLRQFLTPTSSFLFSLDELGLFKNIRKRGAYPYPYPLSQKRDGGAVRRV
jgi:hypothetical protein